MPAALCAPRRAADRRARADRTYAAPLSGLRRGVEALQPYLPHAAEIEQFWCDETHREASAWTAHRDINDVMLAASLAPEGVALLAAVRQPQAAERAHQFL